MTDFIQAHIHDDPSLLALQRSRYSSFNDEQWHWILQQIEGFQRTRDKLPHIHTLHDWWYPVRLSLEQCSSELTAQYKAELITQTGLVNATLMDLTGGMGIDCFYMAQVCQKAIYCERDPELCRLAEHNLQRYASCPIEVKNEEIQSQTITSCDADIIYIDPARRDKNGGKVFKIEDCEPNVLTLLPAMQTHASLIMIKLSPMLDITAALRSLMGDWNVRIVAVKNKVKEILLIHHTQAHHTPDIEAIDLVLHHELRFTRQQEQETNIAYASAVGAYLYEPNAAILKAGAYKYIAFRYGVSKLGINTHLYTSDTHVTDWPGRVWRVLGMYDKHQKNQQYNVLTRNYVLPADALKRQLHLSDGGHYYLIGTRLQDQPMLIIGEIV